MLDLDSYDIMNLLSMAPSELDNPKRFAQFEEVNKFFSGHKDTRSKILNVTLRYPSRDKLDTIWSYVRLHREKEALVKKLVPGDFDDEVKKELEQGYLTLEKQKRIREDIDRRGLETLPGVSHDSPVTLPCAHNRFSLCN